MRVLLFALMLVFPWSTLLWGGEKMEVRDALGRTISLKLPVRRIVTLNSDSLEILRILGAGGLVVGTSSLISREPEFWPEFQGLPDVGKWNGPDPESIVALMPDLVLCYGHSPGPSLETQVGSLGIPILRLDCFRPGSLENDIRTLARVLGREKQARAYLAWHSEKMERIRLCAASASQKPLVYMEAYGEFKASGPGTSMDEMCGLAGGINIAGAAALENPEITTEWILSRAPDVMVKAGSVKKAYGAPDDSEISKIHERILARPGFDQIPALKQGRVHVLAACAGPGPRCVVGLAYMARWFYPEACHALSPEAIHAEYMERFQRLPLKGSYVYP